MIDWSLFRTGWRRRSALMLNTAGCPHWLIRWRCPKSATVLAAFVALGNTLGRSNQMLTDFLDIPADASARDILAAIDQLREEEQGRGAGRWLESDRIHKKVWAGWCYELADLFRDIALAIDGTEESLR